MSYIHQSIKFIHHRQEKNYKIISKIISIQLQLRNLKKTLCISEPVEQYIGEKEEKKKKYLACGKATHASRGCFQKVTSLVF
jgi:hypothetical protein